jgi:hypothetical protein
MRGLSQRYLETAMRLCLNTPAKVFLLLFLCSPVIGQTLVARESAGPTHRIEINDDPKYILEVGAATSWTTTGGSATFAPNLAAETTPIEHWLELEAGVSPFFTRNSTEWDTDLLFKKPWTLSDRAEFMLGLGPQWVYFKQNGRSSNTLTGEVAGDFMFWPTGRHHFGWYLEPAYDYSLAAGHQKSIGMSAGLLIGLRRRSVR